MDKLDSSKGYFGVFLQYPGLSGNINDIEPVIKNCKEKEIKVAVAADILSLALLKSPGEMGADVVVGSTQRFGIPLVMEGHTLLTLQLKRIQKKSTGKNNWGQY